MACSPSNQKPNKEELKTKIITSRVSIDIDTPPPFLQSNFKNIHDWLNDICNQNKPKVEISKFEIGLVEGENPEGTKEYMLHLIGTNTYNKGNHSEIRNDFIPKNAYFSLPKEFSKDLSYAQVLDKIIVELKDFTKSNTFKQSFFTSAKEIKFNRTNQTIWSR